MRYFRHLLLASTAGSLFVGGAQAADLPTKKAPAAPPPTLAVCTGYQDFFTTPCKLSVAGVTLYGTIDIGVGYSTFGAPWNRDVNFSDNFLISKAGRPHVFEAAPNALSQSNVGVSVKEDFAPGWSFVGRAETGFDPFSMQLANGPESMAENTALKLPAQSTSGDSARAGQWFNSQVYAGLASTTFGTLTFGRQNTLLLDDVNAYDPMGGSYAFSVIGFSGTTAGGGNTEDTRSNSAFKYHIDAGPFRAGALAQVGGYAQGNGASGLYQGELGFDAYGFSFDAAYSYAEDSVKLSTFNGTPTAAGGFPTPPTDALKATISDDTTFQLVGKYKWNQLTLFGGYEWIQYANPSSQWATKGTPLTVLGGYYGQNQGDAFYTPEHLQVYWTGAKYAVTPDLDATIAYYHYNQNYYMASSTSTPCSNTSHSNCAGTLDAASALLDWRFMPKFDTYAGAMFSEVNNGLANGYQKGGHVNIDPTVGLRFRF